MGVNRCPWRSIDQFNQCITIYTIGYIRIIGDLMYKLTIEVLNRKVRDIDEELIFMAKNGIDATRLISIKVDILKAIKALREV